MNSSEEYDISFNFVRFLKFLEEHNIIATAIAAVLSDRINEITNSFVNYLVMPIINRDADNDGKRDIKNLEDRVFAFKGVRIQIGKFLLSIIKFIIITYIIFIISSSFKKIRKIHL